MSTVKIWQILEGPTSVEEMPIDEECPEETTHFCVCKAEVNGKMETMNIWFESFEDAYEWHSYFQTNIEPLELDNT